MNYYILCIPYFVLSIAHICCCTLTSTKPATVTRILLMPALVLTVCAASFTGILPKFSVSPVITAEAGILYRLSKLPVFIIFALICGTFGDFYFTRPVSKQSFVRGITAFSFGHIFYLLEIVPRSNFWLLSKWFVLICFLVYAGILYAVYSYLNKPYGLRGLGCVVYAMMLLSVNFFCLSSLVYQVMFSNNIAYLSKAFEITLVGNITFIVSYSATAISIFKKDFAGSRHLIMLTYCLAQFLLVTGLI